MNMLLIFGIILIQLAYAEQLPACDDATFDSYMKNFSEYVCNSVCGDGLVTSVYETCDLGKNNTANGASGCSTQCHATRGFQCTRYGNLNNGPNTCVPICGDGIVVPGLEECDSVDGCGSNCKAALGFKCAPSGPFRLIRCLPISGDAMANGDEECDTASHADAMGFYSGGCDTHCQIKNASWPSVMCPGRVRSCANLYVNVCGDGVTAGVEQCEPPNSFGCNASCFVAKGFYCDGLGCYADKCGDGVVTFPEECDSKVLDAKNPGCTSQCRADVGYRCDPKTNQCKTVCGDGLVTAPEECDGNSTLVGCKNCLAMNGYSCVKNVCSPICGDGIVISPEECDYGFRAGVGAKTHYEPGCTSSCRAVPGYDCTRSNLCYPHCGDGLVIAPEECDNNSPGCNNGTCRATFGYKCSNNTCVAICGDGYIVRGVEDCDYGGNWSAVVSGCDAVTCRQAPGYNCSQTGACGPICGDGVLIAPEICDKVAGCENATCRPRPGYKCSNNTCHTICGDGLVIAPEQCDHGRAIAFVAAGCDAVTCRPADGYKCVNNKCFPDCGDRKVNPPEQCDGVAGCTGNCTVAVGYRCQPKNNTCDPICGDGLVITPEECDHGNNRNRMLNGCNVTCRISRGYLCPNNVCEPICGDGLVFPPEQCDHGTNLSLKGCYANNCSAMYGYKCVDNICEPICGDGVVIEPEECDHERSRTDLAGCNLYSCQVLDGYNCTDNVCKPFCGDLKVIAPEQCDNKRVGCAEDCQPTPGYTCAGNDCQTICGDFQIIAPEECDVGPADTDGCKSCRIQPGYKDKCLPGQECALCPSRKIYFPFKKVPFPFPSIENYTELLQNLSFFACSDCEHGQQSFYQNITETDCLPRVFQIETASCSYACNGYSFVSPLESITYLRGQLAKEDFVNQVIGALFGPRYKVTIEASAPPANAGNGLAANASLVNRTKRGLLAYLGADRAGGDGTTVAFALQNCQASDPNVTRIFSVISGLATDIVPNASLLTSVVTGCRMETSSANPGLPLPFYAAGLPGLFILLLLVCAVVVMIYLVRKYYKDDLHQLPNDISWSFLNKLTHPWLWEFRGNNNSYYYIRKYELLGAEYRRVKQSLLPLSGLRDLPILDIYAIYNPALITSFVNQYNVFRSRKINDPDQFFKISYKNSPQKLWVKAHFDRFADKYSWNEDLASIVPIIPALHGADFSLAENISMTGFASLSTLNDGYYGKGIYFTTSLNYAMPVAFRKDNPVAIYSYINMGNIFPVTEHHKGLQTLMGKGLKSGYNSHYVITTRDGDVYDQGTQGTNIIDTPNTEIVVTQESQILPAFIITLDRSQADMGQRGWAYWGEGLSLDELEFTLAPTQRQTLFQSAKNVLAFTEDDKKLSSHAGLTSHAVSHVDLDLSALESLHDASEHYQLLCDEI